jgi:hypothetical protein
MGGRARCSRPSLVVGGDAHVGVKAEPFDGKHGLGAHERGTVVVAARAQYSHDLLVDLSATAATSSSVGAGTGWNTAAPFRAISCTPSIMSVQIWCKNRRSVSLGPGGVRDII